MIRLTKESSAHSYACEVLDSVCEYENSLLSNAKDQRRYIDFHYDFLYRFDIANTFNYFLFVLAGFLTIVARRFCLFLFSWNKLERIKKVYVEPNLAFCLQNFHIFIYIFADKTKPFSNRFFDQVDIENFGKYAPKIPEAI